MSQLKDSDGNEFQGQKDQTNNQALTDARTITHVLNSVNGEVFMDLYGKAVALFDIRTAAGALTLVFEGSFDGANYFPLPAFVNAQNLAGVLLAEQYAPSIVVATTLTGFYTVGVSGFKRVRVRVSAYTSGNVTVAARASIADQIIYARPIPSTLMVTATAAVNTGATATLPAAGVGMFHYITKIELVKLYSVIGVAAGAGVIITSTNLPGGPAWTTEQLASVAGTVVKVIDYEFTANPLKSLVANTATTFVAGAQLQTIWRWNVSYYVGM